MQVFGLEHFCSAISQHPHVDYNKISLASWLYCSQSPIYTHILHHILVNVWPHKSGLGNLDHLP